MIVYEVIKDIDYSPHKSYGLFLNRSSAESALEMQLTLTQGRDKEDFHIDAREVDVS
jgi:hypothetical protein